MVKLFFFFLSVPMLMLALIHFNTERSSLCSTIEMKLRRAPSHLPAHSVSSPWVRSRVSSRLLMWVCWEVGQAEGWQARRKLVMVSRMMRWFRVSSPIVALRMKLSSMISALSEISWLHCSISSSCCRPRSAIRSPSPALPSPCPPSSRRPCSRRLICLCSSGRSLRKSGWWKSWRDWSSVRSLVKLYMLSCLRKEAQFLCLKQRGRRVVEKRATCLTAKPPSWPHPISPPDCYYYTMLCNLRMKAEALIPFLYF